MASASNGTSPCRDRSAGISAAVCNANAAPNDEHRPRDPPRRTTRLPRAMGKNILIIDAHPDRARGRLGHALADKYAAAAEAGGHLTQVVRLCELEFPWLRSAAEF